MADRDVRWVQRLENDGRTLATLQELLNPGSVTTWMAMIRSRNLTSDTYNPALAKEIVALILSNYGPTLLELQSSMQQRSSQR